MSELRVFLFGRFAVTCDDTPLPLEASKAQELLAYLLLHRGHAHSREKLATLLWPDSNPSRSKTYLRQALWQLQSALGDYSDLISVEAEWIQIDGEAAFWLDVDSFESAAAAALGVQGPALAAGQAAALGAAATLYRADLLEQWFQDWCVFERERLNNMHLAMLEKLMSYCQTHGRYEEGIAYAICLLRCEPAHERTYRFLMRLYALGGNRTAALRTYERCVAALADGLGVKPGEPTTDLYHQIQDGRFPASTTVSADPGLAIGGVLVRLEYLEQMLVEAQHQVSREIERLRRALLRS